MKLTKTQKLIKHYRILYTGKSNTMTEYSIRANNVKIDEAITTNQELKRSEITAKKAKQRRRLGKNPGRLNITTIGLL